MPSTDSFFKSRDWISKVFKPGGKCKNKENRNS